MNKWLVLLGTVFITAHSQQSFAWPENICHALSDGAEGYAQERDSHSKTLDQQYSNNAKGFDDTEKIRFADYAAWVAYVPMRNKSPEETKTLVYEKCVAGVLPKKN